MSPQVAVGSLPLHWLGFGWPWTGLGHPQRRGCEARAETTDHFRLSPTERNAQNGGGSFMKTCAGWILEALNEVLQDCS
jgi:hypothetical protein